MLKSKLLILIVLSAVVAGIGWQVFRRFQENGQEQQWKAESSRIVPVNVEPVKIGEISLHRSFTGTLQAHAEFVVAPKVSGRIEEISVDLSDTVIKGQPVAKLDNAEYVQALTQAEADLAVARANLSEAQSLLEIANRELDRVEKLSSRGVSSEADQDTAIANQLARAAHVEVTKAQVTRARSAVETARIRLGYSEVTAEWQGGDNSRVVAERYVDEGDTVAANTRLLRIVELDPVVAVVFVTERDYGLLKSGQAVELTTDAYPDERFNGEISRISPVFQENTRQARIELTIENPQQRLKPGMFVRAFVILQKVNNAVIVPERALVIRDGETGVFQVAPDQASVIWRPVETGIQQDDQVQLLDSDLDGMVIVLGQQLLDDGSEISIVSGIGQ